MEELKNKKFSLSTLFTSITLIIFISILKEGRFDEFYLFGTYYTYSTSLFFLFVIVILSILLLIYLDDKNINESVLKIKTIVPLLKPHYFIVVKKLSAEKEFYSKEMKNIDYRFIFKYLIVFIVLGSFVFWIITYYNMLLDETEKGIQHSIFIHLFIGFMGTLKIVIPISIIIGVIKLALSKK
jgi:hypothetical protein